MLLVSPEKKKEKNCIKFWLYPIITLDNHINRGKQHKQNCICNKFNQKGVMEFKEILLSVKMEVPQSGVDTAPRAMQILDFLNPKS